MENKDKAWEKLGIKSGVFSKPQLVLNRRITHCYFVCDLTRNLGSWKLVVWKKNGKRLDFYIKKAGTNPDTSLGLFTLSCEQAPKWGTGRRPSYRAWLADFSFRPTPHFGACS